MRIWGYKCYRQPWQQMHHGFVLFAETNMNFQTTISQVYGKNWALHHAFTIVTGRNQAADAQSTKKGKQKNEIVINEVKMLALKLS